MRLSPLRRVVAAWVSLGLVGGLCACGAATAAEPAGTTASVAHVPTRVEILAAGCPSTYAEALALVGPLARIESDAVQGTPPHDRPTPGVDLSAPAEPWPAECAYPDGLCRTVRYQVRCAEQVEFRCGDEEELSRWEGSPCDRPDPP